MKYLALCLLSVGLWLMAFYIAVNGWIANFGEGNAMLLLLAVGVAVLAWNVWPEHRDPPKTDPWSL